MPAVTVVVTDNDRILLRHRVDNDMWAMPGGAIDIGETPPSPAAVRETREETSITSTCGMYSDPGHVIAYDNGEIRQ